jgi:acyl-coenzyme A thioesterase PaaI-like protein
MTTLFDTLAARMGIRAEQTDGTWTAVLDPYAELEAHGVVRISVWALMADMVGGMTADAVSGDDWTFTTDLSVRAPRRRVPGRVVGTSRALRMGRHDLATEVWMREDDGSLFAYAHAGFTRLARRPGDNPKPVADANAQERWFGRKLLDAPLALLAGCDVVDASRGRLEVELTDVLRNPAGAMQGAMVALVGEVSAEAIATHHTGVQQVVTDLDVRYLAMGRVGPIVSTATLIGPPDAGSIAVELRDRGNGDRVVSALLARTAPAPTA